MNGLWIMFNNSNWIKMKSINGFAGVYIHTYKERKKFFCSFNWNNPTSSGKKNLKAEEMIHYTLTKFILEITWKIKEIITLSHDSFYWFLLLQWVIQKWFITMSKKWRHWDFTEKVFGLFQPCGYLVPQK